MYYVAIINARHMSARRLLIHLWIRLYIVTVVSKVCTKQSSSAGVW